jgi:hypothetical protein
MAACRCPDFLLGGGSVRTRAFVLVVDGDRLARWREQGELIRRDQAEHPAG